MWEPESLPSPSLITRLFRLRFVISPVGTIIFPCALLFPAFCLLVTFLLVYFLLVYFLLVSLSLVSLLLVYLFPPHPCQPPSSSTCARRREHRRVSSFSPVPVPGRRREKSRWSCHRTAASGRSARRRLGRGWPWSCSVPMGPRCGC
jgi:hypothetical protein